MGEPGTLEWVKIREVSGAFPSRSAATPVVDDLLGAGFDRADIDVSPKDAPLFTRTGGPPLPAAQLAAMPNAPRTGYVAPEDTAFVVGLCAAIFGGFGALIGALVVSASGGTTVWAAVVAVIAGAAGCTLGVMVARYLGWGWTLPWRTPAGPDGVVLWARVRTPEREERALDILQAHHGEPIRVHVIEVDKRLEGLPLSVLRPDPWLGGEPLGAP